MSFQPPAARDVFICIILAAAVVLVYGQVAGHDFIAIDDQEYVYENPAVRNGLSWSGVKWAFTSIHSANWHPLTWISHMADCTFFGMNAGAHHLVNLAFHTATSILVFLFFRLTTDSPWSSAFLAAVFALHPLHVESVAWISERKDVLSAFFWFVTLILYAVYQRDGRWRFYLLSLGAFALGLMAKPMLVTLPFVLVLMDIWPLRTILKEAGTGEGDRSGQAFLRFRRQVGQSVAEKALFFFLTVVSSTVTLIAQKSWGATATLEAVRLSDRVANALVSYVQYIGHTLYPAGLGVFYPLEGGPSLWAAAAAGGFLAAVSFTAVLSLKDHPYFFAGWFWFFGTLVPVIGLVQVGAQRMADRYMYIPIVGLGILITWGVPGLCRRLRIPTVLRRAGAVLLICAMIPVTYQQTGYWKDTGTLSRRTLQVVGEHPMLHTLIGRSLYEEGKFRDAQPSFLKALAMNPEEVEALNNLGLTLGRLGRHAEAATYYRQVLSLKPDHADAHYNLGNSLSATGDLHLALEHYRKALDLEPADADFHYSIALVLERIGKTDEAASGYAEALKRNPSLWQAHSNLGVLRTREGKYTEAIGHFEESLRFHPDHGQTYVNLGAVYATMGDYRRAVELFSKAVRMEPGNPTALRNLQMARRLMKGDES